MEATKNSTILYGYGADNRRIYESKRMQVATNGDTIEEYVTFWSGQRVAKYWVRWNGTVGPGLPPGPPDSFVFAKMEENLYFGSKPLRVNGTWNLAADRLGSIRSGNGKDYFPYGQENPTTTAGDKDKYATYKHDAATDLSYADQRYYATGAGRFMSADRYKGSIDVGVADSWNRFAYAGADPVNLADRTGLGEARPGSGVCDGSSNTDPDCQRCPEGFFWEWDPGSTSVGHCVPTIPEIPPSPSAGGGGGNFSNGLTEAKERALDRLSRNKDCFDMITRGSKWGTVERARARFGAVSVEFSDQGGVQRVDGSQSNWFGVVQWGETNGSSIYLNSRMFPGSDNKRFDILGRSRTALDIFNNNNKATLSAAEMEEAVIIHEFWHIADGSSTAREIDTLSTQIEMIKTCFPK